jgi:serine/threonine protein kinase
LLVRKGGFGFVDLVVDIYSKKEMVLKRCNVDRSESMNTVKKEIYILQRFAGPYIVKIIDSDIVRSQRSKNSKEALILLDYCPGGHLLERLLQRNGSLLPADSVYRIFGQILLGVKVLHTNNPPIIHRDLKLENVLFGTVSFFDK